MPPKREGITPAELAAAAECAPEPVEAWVRAAHASELLEHDGTRVRMDDAAASVLLDETRPEYLGGQFVVAVVSSLDYAGLAGVLQDRPADRRAPAALPPRDRGGHRPGHRGLLPGGAGRACPTSPAALAPGVRILDVACGGGKWLIAVATRFPATELVGVEFEPDSVARAMRHVTDAGLEKRIRIEAREIPSMPYSEEFDLVYMQDALHELPDPVASLKAAWKAVRPGGRLVVFEWCLPPTLEDSQNLQAELLWGIQIDELYQGTRMYTHDGLRRDVRRGGGPAAERRRAAVGRLAVRRRPPGLAADPSPWRSVSPGIVRECQRPCLRPAPASSPPPTRAGWRGTRPARTASSGARSASSATPCMLHDPVDREPFWNRVAGIRLAG